MREFEQYRDSDDKLSDRRNLLADQVIPRVEDNGFHLLKDVLTGRVIVYGLQSLLSRVIDE